MRYDFEVKREYREKVWRFFNQALALVPRKKRRVLILDTSEALEVSFLINSGYSSENITVVNKSKAHLAWLSRRIAPRKVNTVAGDIFDVLRGEKNFHAINLDLTCPLSRSLLGRLEKLRLNRGTAMSVTILRGREADKDLVRDCYSDLFDETSELHRDIFTETVNAFAKQTKQPLAVLNGLQVQLPYDRVSVMGKCVMDLPSPLLNSDMFRIISICGGPSVTKRFVWGRYKSSAGNQTLFWGARIVR